MEHIEAIVGLLLSLSITSERLVEIIKSRVSWLNTASSDPDTEGKRRAALQSLAIVCGIVTAFLASPVLSQITGLNGMAATFAMGFLAGGGSGFWNAIMSYILQVKELKKLEINEKKGNQ